MPPVCRCVLVLLLLAPGLGAQIPVVDAVRPGNGVTTPQPTRQVPATYPAAALHQGVEGSVKLECVVTRAGLVESVRVVEPLHPLVDEAAVAALREWRFTPGMRDGTPVAVLIDVEMTFSRSPGPRLDSNDVFKPGPGVTVPRVENEVKPEYPLVVREAGISGTVTLECVVLPSGRVGATRVARRLHPVLDRMAVEALRQWRFAPGQRDGVPVPVQVQVEMSFLRQ